MRIETVKPELELELRGSPTLAQTQSQATQAFTNYYY